MNSSNEILVIETGDSCVCPNTTYNIVCDNGPSCTNVCETIKTVGY